VLAFQDEASIEFLSTSFLEMHRYSYGSTKAET